MRLPFRVFDGAVREVFRPAGPHAIPEETDLTRTVRRALQAGNGRSCMATRSEIERRLAEDGIGFDREVLETTLTAMFKDGRLDQTDAGEFFTVDAAVERAARVIATVVRERLVISRTELYEGTNPEHVDHCLAHAVAMEWCVLDGLQLVRPGPVNHRPAQPIGDPNAPSWGPDESVGLFRTAPQRLG